MWARTYGHHLFLPVQVIVLRMTKPPSFKATPGMFVFLNIPSIAKSGEDPPA